MKGDHIDINNIANLAHIELTTEEKTKFTKHIDAIINYISKIDEINTDNVESSAHAIPIYNVFRKDVPSEPFDVTTALMNAPSVRDNQLVINKVL